MQNLRALTNIDKWHSTAAAAAAPAGGVDGIHCVTHESRLTDFTVVLLGQLIIISSAASRLHVASLRRPKYPILSCFNLVPSASTTAWRGVDWKHCSVIAITQADAVNAGVKRLMQESVNNRWLCAISTKCDVTGKNSKTSSTWQARQY